MPDPALDLPRDWATAAERILHGEEQRILVVGARDAGKTVFCRVVLSGAQRSGRIVHLLDADLGQKMVGPPACVTLGEADGNGSIALLRFVFVGTTNPVRGRHRLIEGASLLAADCGADLLIVNTGGLLAGPGLPLKLSKVEALSPDLVIGIGEGRHLDAVLARIPPPRAIQLPSSPSARRKTEGERRAARRLAFQAHFADARERSVSLAGIEIRDAYGIGRFPPVGLLFGFGEGPDSHRGLGVVRAVDPAGSLLTCLAPAALESALWLDWGTLKLREDFTDAP